MNLVQFVAEFSVTDFDNPVLSGWNDVLGLRGVLMLLVLCL